MTATRWITALFHDAGNADRACQVLLEDGYARGEINIIMTSATYATHFGKLSQRHVADSEHSVSALADTVMASCTPVTAPGVDLVIVGPILEKVPLVGVSVRTLTGAITGFDPVVAQTGEFERGIREGGMMISVQAHGDDDQTHFRQHWADRLAEQAIQQTAST